MPEARIKIHIAEDPRLILVDLRELPRGLAAEIANLLFNYGAEPGPQQALIKPLEFRRASFELAGVLSDREISAELDDATKLLLDKQLREAKAVRSSSNLLPLGSKDVQQAVSRTGRFRRSLTDCQLRDLGKLLVLLHGANFSVPGSGKTATLLAVHEALLGMGYVNRLLVVAPKNAFGAWEAEIEKCYPTAMRPKLRRVEGGIENAIETLRLDPEAAILSYQFLPNILPQLREWARSRSTHLVLDEAHRIKGGTHGVYSNAALELCDAAVRRDILTGTPLPQSLEDLRPQLEFLWPGQRILPEVRVSSEESPDRIEEVEGIVRPLFVRTTKNELKLPPVSTRVVSVSLGPIQRELYELMRSEAKRVAVGLNPTDRAQFRTLGRKVMYLLEAASNPMLVAAGLSSDDFGGGESATRAFELLREFARHETPAKIRAAVALAHDLLGGGSSAKLVIWTSFIQNIFVLEKLLAEFNPVVLYGAVGTGDEQDPDTREGRLRRFHAERGCRLMIANPAACGEGISLHEVCHVAVYLDRTFNAAHYLQSVDRIHRLGLSKDTTTEVIILQADWTVDVRVARRLAAKIETMSRILNDPGLAALAYDPADVTEEFPAGLEPADLAEVVKHIAEGEGA